MRNWDSVRISGHFGHGIRTCGESAQDSVRNRNWRAAGWGPNVVPKSAETPVAHDPPLQRGPPCVMVPRARPTRWAGTECRGRGSEADMNVARMRLVDRWLGAPVCFLL